MDQSNPNAYRQVFKPWTTVGGLRPLPHWTATARTAKPANPLTGDDLARQQATAGKLAAFADRLTSRAKDLIHRD